MYPIDRPVEKASQFGLINSINATHHLIFSSITQEPSCALRKNLVWCPLKMARIDINNWAKALPEHSLSDLEQMQQCLSVALGFARNQAGMTSDELGSGLSQTRSDSLANQALQILGDEDQFHPNLPDQSLLAAVILSREYGQDTFNNRDINDTIEAAGRPRVAHITSAVAGLRERQFLSSPTRDSKDMTLSPEGLAKARQLVHMFIRQRQQDPPPSGDQEAA